MDFRRLLASSVLPQPCAICGAAGGYWPVCADCEQTLPRPPEAGCIRCAEDLPSAVEAVAGSHDTSGPLCGECMRTPPPYQRTYAAFRYEFPVSALISDLKFAGRLQMGPWLAAALYRSLERVSQRFDRVIAMPLHHERLRERGFNQAMEIARPLARNLGIQVDNKACARVRATAHQIDLDAEARKRNVRGAFVCHQDLSGQRVLVVDDVMTTGATLAELSKTLQAAGATHIAVAVAARTPQR